MVSSEYSGYFLTSSLQLPIETVMETMGSGSIPPRILYLGTGWRQVASVTLKQFSPKVKIHLREAWLDKLTHQPTNQPTNQTQGLQPFLRNRHLCNYSGIFQHLWNLEVHFCVTRNLHWSLSRTISIQSKPFHPIPLRSLLILSTELRLSLN
jgi:hypothetical protein